MSRPMLPAIALVIATTLVYACTAAKGPTTNGPAPTQSAGAATANRDIAAKLFARGNHASPKGDIKVASVLKDAELGLVVSNFQMRVEPAKTLSTKAEDSDGEDSTPDSGDTNVSTPASDDETHAVTPTASPHSDDAEAAAEDWDHNSDASDDEWLDHEAQDDADDIDAYGETDAGVAGKPPHHLVFHENDYPVMGEDEDSFTVEDQTAGQKKAVFTADQDYLHFSATGASGKKLSVTLNPDGTYTVNGQTVSTAKEAAKLVNGALSDGDITSETLAFLYAVLKRRDEVASTLGANCGIAGTAPTSPTELVHELLAQRLGKN